jgi:uncharacterized protein (AIM24 family)
MAHEVDYKIVGDDMQFVEVELDPESAVAEAGAMMYMSGAIGMETIFGDGSAQRSGVIGALLGAGRRLRTGESLFITVFTNQGSGKHVALQPSVSYDIQLVGGVKTALFGGEGLFFATLTGPGRVWLQSLPLSRLAGRIYKAIPGIGGSRRDEGSILGGIGDLLDGDS